MGQSPQTEVEAPAAGGSPRRCEQRPTDGTNQSEGGLSRNRQPARSEADPRGALVTKRSPPATTGDDWRRRSKHQPRSSGTLRLNRLPDSDTRNRSRNMSEQPLAPGVHQRTAQQMVGHLQKPLATTPHRLPDRADAAQRRSHGVIDCSRAESRSVQPGYQSKMAYQALPLHGEDDQWRHGDGDPGERRPLPRDRSTRQCRLPHCAWLDAPPHLDGTK
jgi:hypothetical protein